MNTPNPHRIGLVVPSSNVTVETEMPRLLGRHRNAGFTFHSSRMRMHTVSPEGLAAMNAQRERCVTELADADVDVVLYACLVAIMADGPGKHRDVEADIADVLTRRGTEANVLSSAGALVTGLRALAAERIALVAPYVRSLTQLVVDYLVSEGFDVGDWRALEIPDNAEVGRIPGESVMEAARSLDLSGVDALVISACVQMPSLDLVQAAEDELGIPVLSAATAGAYGILRATGSTVDLPGAGGLLRLDAESDIRPVPTQKPIGA